MKNISFEDIKSLNISPVECYKWVNEMILNKKDALLPAKIHMNMPENKFCNVMPSILRIHDNVWGGVKVVTRYPNRIPALDSKILLFNAITGEFLALLDGNWITAMRTGAVAAHSVINLAKRDFKNIGMIGLGNTARATLIVLSEMLPNRNFKIKLFNYKDQADLFKKRFSDFPNLNFSFADSYEQIVRGAEVVISCATYFENDICKDECFDEGVLVVPVHTRGFTNCDLFFDKVYADDTGHVEHFKNFSKFKFFAEVSDIMNGNSKGRESERERILVYNIGISVHDIYYAARIYQMLQSKPNLFDSLSNAFMKEPTEKFWV